MKAGFTPQVHAIGDRAVRATLDDYAAVRRQAGKRPRLAIAHAELVDPADYGRFKSLDVTPVMSFQWGKPAPDSIEGAKVFMGPERFDRMEPEGRLQDAGARIAFGSDWPVDALNEFFALEVGVTRRNEAGERLRRAPQQRPGPDPQGGVPRDHDPQRLRDGHRAADRLAGARQAGRLRRAGQGPDEGPRHRDQPDEGAPHGRRRQDGVPAGIRSARAPARRARGDLRRQQIVEAALAEIRTQAVADVQLSAIAERAG